MSPRIVLVVVVSLLLVAAPALGASTSWAWITEGALGLLGGAVGAAVAVTAIGELTPLVSSSLAKTAIVVSGLTVGAGLGAAAGVLLAAELLVVDGHVRYGLVGGLVGGLLAAFAEPILYLLGVPEGLTELLGLALLPVLPTIGAVAGFHVPLPTADGT